MNVTNRKMFRPRNARNKLNQMGGIMSSSPELMQTVQRFQLGGSVPDPYFARMTQDRLPAIRPGSFADQPITSIMDFIGQANRESGIGQIMQTNEMARAGVTPQDLARVEAATAANRTADQADDIARVQAATEANQIADMTAERMLAGQDPTMRGPTAEDVRVFQTSQMPTRPGQLDTANIETLRGPTADSYRSETAGATETLRGGTIGDWREFLSKTVPQVNADDNQEILTVKGQQTADAAVDVLKAKDVTDEDKNNMVLEFIGKKDPEKDLTKKERIMKNKEFYRELFGRDPEEDKKIDGYNLAMMGFLIASGDSPNALQNIARGAAAGVQNFMKSAEKRRDREDKLTQLAVADYQAQVKSEAAREEFRLEHNLRIQELLDKRDQAKSKERKDRFNAYLGAMDDTASALAFVQLDKTNVDLGTAEGFKKFTDLRSSIIEANPDLAVDVGGFRDSRSPIEMVDNFMSDYRKADTPGQRQIRKDVAGAMGIEDPNNVTISDIRAFAEQQAAANVASGQRIATGSAPAPAPAPAAQVFTVGQMVVDEAQGISGTVQADGSVVDSSGNVVAPAGTIPLTQ